MNEWTSVCWRNESVALTDSQCVDAPTFVWAAEIFPTTIRAKGLSLAQVGFSLGAITYATPAPLAYRNM